MSISEGGQIVALKELDAGYTHAENLHVFADALIREKKLSYRDLSAIAVSRGPGSYTGLRIGVSAAKGFCFALEIPLISVDTLKIIAAAADVECGLLCPMIDARRMEVYTALYDSALERQGDVEALVVTEEVLEKYAAYRQIYFVGNGMPKCRGILSQLPGARFVDDVKPSASHMARFSAAAFAEQRFEDVAYFEPYYLKDFISGSEQRFK